MTALITRTPRGGNARFISAGEGCSGNRRFAIAVLRVPPPPENLFTAVLLGPPARKSDKNLWVRRS
jgi:hypothetical protein